MNKVSIDVLGFQIKALTEKLRQVQKKELIYEKTTVIIKIERKINVFYEKKTGCVKNFKISSEL